MKDTVTANSRNMNKTKRSSTAVYGGTKSYIRLKMYEIQSIENWCGFKFIVIFIIYTISQHPYV